MKYERKVGHWKLSYNLPQHVIKFRRVNYGLWYNHYIEWGEYPCETRAKKQKFNQLSKQWERTKVVSESIVSTLRDIVEESPEFYIDEIAEELSK